MSNYAPFFGLTRPIFDIEAGHGFLFESEQLKSAADTFHNAFSKPSPLLCVGGQRGCGKSSTVDFALGQLKQKTHRISVGRVRLSEDEVIDLLLEKLDVDDTSGGTIRKLGRFSKRVEEISASGERVVIIVEEAARIGAGIIAELDVLCGGEGGADVALVICGDEELRTLLRTPDLARLNQRMEAFIDLTPLAVDELEDYLRSAITQAGGTYDTIFGKDYAGLTHILSCGVPRIVNKLTDACLSSAAKAGERRVSCALLADIAKSRFDIQIELPVHRKETPNTEPETTPAEISPADNINVPEPSTVPRQTDHRSSAAIRQMPDVNALIGNRPLSGDSPASNTRDVQDTLIPHLIQDTQQDLRAIQADADHESADDTSGNFHKLPNLDDLTAEFAAVSQMIESLPTSRYDLLDESNPVDDAFNEFEGSDNAPTSGAVALSESAPDDNVVSGNATSTRLPTLPIPNDTTLNETRVTSEDDGSSQRANEDTIDVSDKLALPSGLPPEAGLKARDSNLKLPESSVSEEIPVEVEPVSATPEPELTPTATIDDSPDAADLSTSDNDLDRDPTLAELTPDLDALQMAMDESLELADESEPAFDKVKAEIAAVPELMPEITLDSSISQTVEESVAARSVNKPVETADDEAHGTNTGPSDTEVHRMMENLSSSNSIEDMDDKLAETLFGDEINFVASQVLRAARDSIDKKKAEVPMELSLEKTAKNPIPTAPPSVAAAEKPTPSHDQDFGHNEVINLNSMKPNAGLDMSATQRLRTVRALNAGMGKPPAAPTPKKTEPSPKNHAPVPIEDQIDISMTATFKALKIDPNSLNQDDDDDKEKKGFFSRFRKG